jgi:hypothetical protein
MTVGAAGAGATPTPIPGGANQVRAVSSTLGQTVFNGSLRITISGLRNATDAETKSYLPQPDQKVMAFSSLLRNGTNDEFTDLVRYTLADKDEVAVGIGDTDVHPANLHILQGAAVRQTVLFAVDKNFEPVKLIVQCATCSSHSSFRAVRFTIPESVLPPS